MIRYEVSSSRLRELIEAEKPGWLDRARQRTESFVQAGKYDETSSIWSEVKAVYMRLQHNKCAYCERRLASEEFGGAIEHDLEHYRPKNTVVAWPTEAIAAERDIRFHFATGDGLDNGYFWLAYEPLNYCTSCKKCNTPLKLNYFPVAAQRGADAVVPEALNEVERPFLVFPLGDLDEAPENIITFDGILAIPRKRNGPRWRRAKVTIAFFELNNREELQRERAECLVALDNALAILESDLPDDRKQQAQRDIERMQSSRSPHASCVRAACEAYVADRSRMIELFQAARDYLDSES
jgi:hypothetical protein